MNKFFKDIKIYHIIFLISVFQILFLSILKINNLLFVSCSITANIFLIGIIKYIKEKLNIKLSSKEKIIIVLSVLITYAFYFYSVLNRKFIYYWDFSCYYNIQIQTIEAFNRGLIAGIRSFVGSTYSGEYGNFLSFFSQIIFQFTNKSINNYILSFIIIFIPYVIYSFTILLKELEKYISVKKVEKELLFLYSFIVLLLFPLLHGVLILGQPDFFGLTFIFLLISITLKYDFKNIEIDRLVLIFLLTFMLIICRRWYLYWVISYYIVYISNIIITNYNNKKDLLKILKNGLMYGVIVIILFLITLFPFIKNTILNNYSSSYSFYSIGGPLTEINSQIKHLGILPFIIIVSGLIYGIINKKYRRYSISIIIEYLIIIVLFTKIQNMGLHHSLLLLVNYLYGFYMFIICIFNNQNIIKKILYILLFTIIISNFLFGYNNKKSLLFTDISLKVEDDINYNEIKRITTWLENNLDENNRGYLITHNNTINPDKLRNFKTPSSNVKKYMPYGSAVIGVHKFPLELFTSKYIMTTTPFESISIEEKYNNVFKELVAEGVFKQIKEEQLKNNIKFEIYERIKPVTDKEKNKYLDSLKEESKEYKNLYEDIINSYIIN